MVWLLEQNYQSGFCRFSIDSEDELDLLPRYGIKGKEKLCTVSSCCPNSKAVCTDGTIYTLQGNTNKWIKFSVASSGGGGSSGNEGADPNWTYTNTDDIDEMFK